MPHTTQESSSAETPFTRFARRIPMLSPLLKRDFRLLWIGEGVSLLGGQFQVVALSWLTLQITGSGLALGTVLMVGAIPRAIFILIGGALSDILSPRRIMIASNLLRSLVVGAVALLVFFDNAELWHLYAFSIIFGIVDSFFHPALNTIIPRVVDRDNLESGNAILRGTHELTYLIGSAPAGILISAAGMDLAFGIDSVAFVLSAICLYNMSEIKGNIARLSGDLKTFPGRGRLDGLLADVKQGLKYTWGKPAFRALILAIAVIDFAFAGPLDVGLAWLANNRFAGGATAFGIILSAFGGGALVGTIISGTVKMRRRGYLLAVIGAFLGIGLTLYGVIGTVFGAALLSVIMGVGVGIFNIVLISWFQKEAPPNMVGRVMSLLTFASVGLMPISFALSGMLVDLHAPFLFALAGGMTLLACLYLLCVPAVREID
jgi:MFS family permease